MSVSASWRIRIGPALPEISCAERQSGCKRGAFGVARAESTLSGHDPEPMRVAWISSNVACRFCDRTLECRIAAFAGQGVLDLDDGSAGAAGRQAVADDGIVESRRRARALQFDILNHQPGTIAERGGFAEQRRQQTRHSPSFKGRAGTTCADHRARHRCASLLISRGWRLTPRQNISSVRSHSTTFKLSWQRAWSDCTQQVCQR
ncbi:hypothetical protein [Dongia sp.]|uniref:hypothetical protein n=1 Tax=Dongia sp. TaxID=1977262 RepID=UPI0035AF9174